MNMYDDISAWHFLISGLHNLKYLVVYLAIYSLVLYWAIFEKAYEPGWAALIPIYNNYVYFKMIWGNGWYFLLLLIPFVNVIIVIITLFKLAKAFGKNFWFALGLFFLGIVFMSILAFGESRYVGVPERDNSFSL